MSQPIKVPFRMWTRVNWGNHILDEGPDPYTGRDNFEGEKRPDQDMTGGRYSQSNSVGDTTNMVQMPI